MNLWKTVKVNLVFYENINREPFIKNLTERLVSNAEDVLQIFKEGKLNRHISVTSKS